MTPHPYKTAKLVMACANPVKDPGKETFPCVYVVPVAPLVTACPPTPFDENKFRIKYASVSSYDTAVKKAGETLESRAVKVKVQSRTESARPVLKTRHRVA